MIDPKLIDVEFKFDGLKDDATEDQLLAAGAKRFPESLLIDRSEWDDRIEELDKQKQWAEDYSGRFTAQANSHECVAHASCQNAQIAFNRQYNGMDNDVWFSPLALYTRVTGGSRWGGSNVLSTMRQMMANGLIPDHDGPAGKNSQQKLFDHTLHETSGRTEDWWPTSGWVNPSELPDGWEETAKHFRALEVYTVPDRAAHASALLRGWCVTNGRNGHSIPHVRLQKDGNRYLSKYKDSYRVYRYDSEKLWGGGFVIRSMTMWNKNK
tara:strand:+ start:730 stop:1530 length:801 start_codon:yes stop_codon:yes gene_type:complete